jgi:hypothetical protein
LLLLSALPEAASGNDRQPLHPGCHLITLHARVNGRRCKANSWPRCGNAVIEKPELPEIFRLVRTLHRFVAEAWKQ